MKNDENKKTSKKKDDKNTGKTLTGKPADKIDLDPDIGPTLVQEVMSIAQRRKRAMVMRRFARKIANRRRILSRRHATKDKLERRAYRAAVRVVRRRVAGKKGQNYADLSPSEKIAISKRVEKKKALIQKLAKRLMPKVRKAEAIRLHKLKTRTEDVNLNDIYNSVDISFELLENKQQKALYKKSEHSGYDVDVIFEVFLRGLEDYPEDEKLTPEQYAFNRINRFIANGEIDGDLKEETMLSFKEITENLTTTIADAHKTILVSPGFPVEKGPFDSGKTPEFFGNVAKNIKEILPKGWSKMKLHNRKVKIEFKDGKKGLAAKQLLIKKGYQVS